MLAIYPELSPPSYCMQYTTPWRALSLKTEVQVSSFPLRPLKLQYVVLYAMQFLLFTLCTPHFSLTAVVIFGYFSSLYSSSQSSSPCCGECNTVSLQENKTKCHTSFFWWPVLDGGMLLKSLWAKIREKIKMKRKSHKTISFFHHLICKVVHEFHLNLSVGPSTTSCNKCCVEGDEIWRH